MTGAELVSEPEAPAAELAGLRRQLDAAHAAKDHEAVVRLDREALELPLGLDDRAAYLAELAWGYEQLGRFDEAVAAMWEAVAAGLTDEEVSDYPSATALIGELLVRGGRIEEAGAAFEQARAANPADPRVHLHASGVYRETGLHDEAWHWVTAGLELALDGDDTDLVWLLAQERAGADDLQERAQAVVDREDREEREQAGRAARASRRPTVLVRPWFPAQEYERALASLPGFAADLGRRPYTDYCAGLDLVLRDTSRQRPADHVGLVEVRVDDYLVWCRVGQRDPDESAVCAAYATERAGSGAVTHWPPGRNAPCWCASDGGHENLPVGGR